jgi:integrase
MKKILSKRYEGVYYSELVDGDKTYYITYKDKESKKVWVKIGKHSQGIRENFCSQARSEQMNKVRLGENVTIGKPKRSLTTLNDIADAYVTEKELHNRGIKVEIQRYDKHIRDDLGRYNIDEITKSHLEALQKKKREEGYADQSVNHMLQMLQTIYNHAIKNGIYKKTNPLLDITYFKISNDRERFLTIEEIKELFEYVKENEQLYLFTKLALTTGARLQAIMDIKKKDIDFSNRIITLNDYKNGSIYKGFFNEDVGELLMRHSADKNYNDTLMTYSRSNVSKRLLKVLNDLFNKGLETKDAQNKVVIHTLRHTFASHLAINGTPIFTIQKLMNHKDIKMTLRYAKLAPDSGRDMVEALYI